MITTIFPDENSNSTQKKVTTYNEYGNEIESITHINEDVKPFIFKAYVYNNKQLVEHEISYGSDKSIVKYDAKFTYNKKDLLVSKTGFSTNTGTKKYFKNTYEYLYDKRGNWIMKLIYRNDELYETTIRVFEYY